MVVMEPGRARRPYPGWLIACARGSRQVFCPVSARGAIVSTVNERCGTMQKNTRHPMGGEQPDLIASLEAQLAHECLETVRIKTQLAITASRAHASERGRREAEQRADALATQVQHLAAHLDRSVAEVAGLREGMKALQEVR